MVATHDTRQPGYLPVLESDNTADPIDALRVYVSQITGLDLPLVRRRWIQKPGTQPGLETDWASVAIDEIRTWATPGSVKIKGLIPNPESGKEKRVSHQTMTVSVWFYGPNAQVKADDFREGAYLGQNNDMLKRQGLTMQGVEDRVRHLPDFAFEQWIDKYEVRLLIGRAVVRTFGVRTIAGLTSIDIKTDIIPNK